MFRAVIQEDDMRKIIVGLIAAGALNFASAAVAGTMEIAFSNHYEVSINGNKENMYFNADGTVTSIDVATNSKRQGTWAYTDESRTTMCVTYTGEAAACYPFDSNKNLGDTWQAGPATVSLKSGR